jgi:hypothetical protein
LGGPVYKNPLKSLKLLEAATSRREALVLGFTLDTYGMDLREYVFADD